MPEDKPIEEEVQSQEPQRERFDEEVIRRSFEFGNELLQDVPELEVLAIVPVWGIPQDKMVPAIYLTKDGTGMSPHQLLLTFDRFLAGFEYKLNRTRELLQATGEMLNKQAGEIDANQKKLEEQQSQLEAQTQGEE
tara:strand:- start:346 stop:753 length:408 start_codon:yes stop_codon:yes gene_type:complete